MALVVGALCLLGIVALVVFMSRSDDEVVVQSYALPAPDLPARSSGSTAPTEACDMSVGPGVERLDSTDVSPGDTVCLTGGRRGPLQVVGVSGSAEEPVQIVNSGGVVVIEADHDDYAGIDIRDSAHLVISGTGIESACGASLPESEQRCGIVIRGSGRGVAGTRQSESMTIDHVEITGTSHSGVFVRTSAEDGPRRGEWVQHDTVVVDNYIHDVGTEGLYLGSSSYADGIDPVLAGVVAARNLVVDAGWDGLQVGSAVEGCVIHDNRIIRAGRANEDDQRSGIINNRGSVCTILGNAVVAPAAEGIYVQGNGGNLVANNVIVQAGNLAPDEGEGINVARGSNESEAIRVVHNTVVNATRIGIRYANDRGSSNEIAYNFIVATPLAIQPVDADVVVSGNIEVPDLDDAGFVDPWNSDFRLRHDSAAVDVGPGARTPVMEDLLGLRRPQGDGFDAGAFEYRTDNG